MKKRQIRELYYKFILDKKRPPKSTKEFLKHSKIDAAKLHSKYHSLNEIEQDIWKKSLGDVIKCIHESSDYSSYSQREKAMALIYSWFEYMNVNARFFRNSLALNATDPSVILKDFRKIMKKFICGNFKQGKQMQEFMDRAMPSSFTESFFWSLVQMNLRSWKKANKHKQDEWMDAMLEKSMTFFFDSLAENIFDTFVEMIKHKKSLWKNLKISPPTKLVAPVS